MIPIPEVQTTMPYLITKNQSKRTPVTLPVLEKKWQEKQPITMLTCYDATFARVIDRCGIDIMLVGDSLGMVVQGHETTLPVAIDDLIYHTQCVARGNQHAFILVDLPFASFATPEQAYSNASKLIQAGAHAVKIEGGSWLFDTIQFLTRRSIPVCAHLGLLPQSVHMIGGFRLQANTETSANKLKRDAIRLQAAGAFMVLLEAIPAPLAMAVTRELHIPTIGIGAGPACSGQVLVLHDMLGMAGSVRPRFVHNFMLGKSHIEDAIIAFKEAVTNGSFPSIEHSFIDRLEISDFQRRLQHVG